MPYHRRNLIILSGTIFMAALSWNQVMPFLPLFLSDLGAKGSALYWYSVLAYSLPAIASILGQPYWIKLGDKYGRKPMIIRAGVCLAAIYFGMSYCSAPWQLVVYRFLNGALTGFIPGSMALIATNTPKDEAPRSMAVGQSASAIGQIAGPPIGFFLAALTGYRVSMRFSGTAVAICTLLVILLVKEPNRVVQTDRMTMLEDIKLALKSPAIYSLMLPMFLAGSFGTTVMSMLSLHLQGMSGDAPSWFKGVVFACPAIALAATAYLWTRFGEKHKFTTSMGLGLTGAAIATVLLTFMGNTWAFAGVFLVAGIFLASLSPSMGALICTEVTDEFRARAYGLLSATSMLGAFLIPFPAALIASKLGTHYIFAYVGILFLIGSFIYPSMLKKNAAAA